MDGSAILTGLLLAMILPPLSCRNTGSSRCIGAVFAVAIGKQIFGGLGHNPLEPGPSGHGPFSRPPMPRSSPGSGAGRPVLLAWAAGKVDAVATATPLYLFKSGTLAKLGLDDSAPAAFPGQPRRVAGRDLRRCPSPGRALPDRHQGDRLADPPGLSGFGGGARRALRPGPTLPTLTGG